MKPSGTEARAFDLADRRCPGACDSEFHPLSATEECDGPKSNQADFTFKIDGLPSDRFQVLRIEGLEENSRPFSFELTLVSTHDNIELDAQIGLPAHLTMRGHNGKRRVHGVVEELELSGGLGLQ